METPWEIGHRGDYNLEEMFDWMDNSVSDARMNPTVKAIKNKLKKKLLQRKIKKKFYEKYS